MKYRIITEVNGNGKKHYEVQFYVKHWYGYRWENTKRQVCDGHFQVNRRYDTLEEAKAAVKEREIMRIIADQGVINEESWRA